MPSLFSVGEETETLDAISSMPPPQVPKTINYPDKQLQIKCRIKLHSEILLRTEIARPRPHQELQYLK